MSTGERYLLEFGQLDSGYAMEENDSPSSTLSFYLPFLFQRDTALSGRMPKPYIRVLHCVWR